MRLADRTPRVFGVVLSVMATVAVAEQLLLTNSLAVGLDFQPLRHAAQALRVGQSVYTDPTFVYPPTAAIVLSPTSLGSEMAAYRCWVALSVAALVLASVLVSRTVPPRWRTSIAAGSVIVLVGSCAASDSLDLGNLSPMLAPLAVGVLIAFDRGRWTSGCALLAVSLLIKPLLVPLLLVPVLRRRWRELAVTMVPAAAALLLAVLTVPGGRSFGRVLIYCLTGTNLHGTNALNNLSLRGWAEAHGQASWAGLIAAAIVIALAIATLAVRTLRRRDEMSPAQLGNLAMLAVLLAGSISEVHFLLVVLATTLAQLALRPSRRQTLLTLPALVALALPLSYVGLVARTGHNRQSWYVLAEVLLFAACVAGPGMARRAQSDTQSAGTESAGTESAATPTAGLPHRAAVGADWA